MKTRVLIGSLTFPDMGSMRCQYVIILSKLINVLKIFSFQLLCVVIQTPVFLK